MSLWRLSTAQGSMEDRRLRARTQLLQLAALFVGTAVRAEILEMPAYQYYNGTNSKIDHLPQQTTITRWQGDALGALDIAFGLPYLTSLRWSSKGQSLLPDEGDFWLRHDAMYVVLDGSIQAEVEGSHPAVLQKGDTLWVRAGTIQRPLQGLAPVTEVMVVGGPWEPSFPSMQDRPVALPEAAAFGGLSSRVYLGRQAAWFVDSHVGGGGAVCGNDEEGRFPEGSVPINGQGACDAYWAKQGSDDPSLFRVHWAPEQKLPGHYHGEGALYLPISGQLCFMGEQCIGTGEARWVRPGYRYPGEYTGREPTEVLVLNVDSPANFEDELQAREIVVSRRRKGFTFTCPGK